MITTKDYYPKVYNGNIFIMLILWLCQSFIGHRQCYFSQQNNKQYRLIYFINLRWFD